MSGGLVPPPPPPPPSPSTTVPPSHEVVVDATAKHTTSKVTVYLDNDHAVVVVHGSNAEGVPLPEGHDRPVRKSEADPDSEQLPD